MEEMKPGFDLDREIAIKVMGYPSPHEPGIDQTEYERRRTRTYPPYSTEISEAWEVVEKLKATSQHWVAFELSDKITENLCGASGDDDEWVAGFCLGRGFESAFGITAPHAICLAALKAVGNE